MPDRITEDLADQQGDHIPARVPGTEYLRDERAGGPRPLRPADKRHALPDRQPSHYRHRPSPAAPGTPAGQRADAGTCTLSSATNVKPARGLRGPRPWPVRRRGPVRGRPRKADGPSDRYLAPIPVRYASVDTATRRSTARQGDTRWDREKRARQPREFAASGPFPHLVAGVVAGVVSRFRTSRTGCLKTLRTLSGAPAAAVTWLAGRCGDVEGQAGHYRRHR